MCGAFDQLTQRELEVLTLVAAGLGSKEVAPLLDPPCSEGTVRAHLKHIYAKLGVTSRTAAAAAWFEHKARLDEQGGV